MTAEKEGARLGTSRKTQLAEVNERAGDRDRCIRAPITVMKARKALDLPKKGLTVGADLARLRRRTEAVRKHWLPLLIVFCQG